MAVTRETRNDDLDRTKRLDESINAVMKQIQNDNGRGWWPYDEAVEPENEWIAVLVWGIRLSTGGRAYPPPGHTFPLAS